MTTLHNNYDNDNDSETNVWVHNVKISKREYIYAKIIHLAVAKSEILALTATCKWYLYYPKNNVHWLIMCITFYLLVIVVYVPEKRKYTIILSALARAHCKLSECFWKDYMHGKVRLSVICDQ